VPSDGGKALGGFLTAHTLTKLYLEDGGVELTAWVILLKSMIIPTLKYVTFCQSDPEPNNSNHDDAIDKDISAAFGSFYSRHSQLLIIKNQLTFAPIERFADPNILPHARAYCGHIQDVVALLNRPKSTELLEVDITDWPDELEKVKPVDRPASLMLATLAIDHELFMSESILASKLLDIPMQRLAVDFGEDGTASLTEAEEFSKVSA